MYTTPGRKEQGRFALSVASKIIPFFVDYFGIDYPLPKADLIGASQARRQHLADVVFVMQRPST